jgi:hypothetical protein
MRDFFLNITAGSSSHREVRASPSLNKRAEASGLHAPLFAMDFTPHNNLLTCTVTPPADDRELSLQKLTCSLAP